MYDHDAEASKYVVEQLKQVQGGRIVDIAAGESDGFPEILVKMTSGKHFWLVIQQDAEGNGPGWVHVEEAKVVGEQA